MNSIRERGGGTNKPSTEEYEFSFFWHRTLISSVLQQGNKAMCGAVQQESAHS